MSWVDLGLAAANLLLGAKATRDTNKAAEKAAESNQAAANATYAAAIRDLSRQSQEAIELGNEEKSDLIRQVDREMSTMRVAAVESGASVGMTERFATEIGFTEGLGLSRIDANTTRFLRSVDSAAERAGVDRDFAISTNANNLVAARRATNMNFLGSSLATVGSLYGKYAAQQVARNTSTQPSLRGFGNWLIDG